MTILVIALAAMSTSPVQDGFDWAAVPAEERAILMELFHATGGPEWTEKRRWGTDAPVCEWYGVGCFPTYEEDGTPISQIRWLLLEDRNLVGELPASLALLPHLESLSVYSNHLTGEFPEVLLERWDRGEFDIRASGNSFSNLIKRIRIEYDSPGVLCGRNVDVIYAVDIEEDGPARFESIRCTEGTDRQTHCLVKEGTGGSMGRLTRALDRLEFDDFEPEYGSSFRTKAIYGDGSAKEVGTWRSEGSIEVWAVQQLFIAVIADYLHSGNGGVWPNVVASQKWRRRAGRWPRRLNRTLGCL